MSRMNVQKYNLKVLWERYLTCRNPSKTKTFETSGTQLPEPGSGTRFSGTGAKPVGSGSFPELA